MKMFNIFITNTVAIVTKPETKLHRHILWAEVLKDQHFICALCVCVCACVYIYFFN